MGHMGWAEHSLAAHLADEERAEAEAEAEQARIVDEVTGLMLDVGASPSDDANNSIDDIQEAMLMMPGDMADSESPERLLREAIRLAAAAWTRKGDTNAQKYHAAGSYLARALEMAAYRKVEGKV